MPATLHSKQVNLMKSILLLVWCLPGDDLQAEKKNPTEYGHTWHQMSSNNTKLKLNTMNQSAILADNILSNDKTA